jgi:hypothetical protein
VKTWALICLAVLTAGCAGLDPRPKALSRGIDQVRSVLAEPKLRSLADKNSKGALEDRLVEALFSADGKKLWPPRLAAEISFSVDDQSRLPGRIAYLGAPELPWAVVIQADAKNHRIWLLGYGMSLLKPMLQDSVVITP